MVRRYTAEEAQAILARKECWDRGYHSTGLRAAAFFGEPPVFERRWHDQDEQCGHCDARGDCDVSEGHRHRGGRVTGEPYTVTVVRRSDGAFLTLSAVEAWVKYRCTVCASCGPWGPGWSWYGSLKDAERNPGALPTFCTDVCRGQWAEDNGLPVELSRGGS